MTVEATIADGLLRALSNAPIGLFVPIVYPNMPFQPAGETYLRASYVPSATSSVDLVQWDRHSGILQIDVMWPENRGVSGGLRLADEIAQYFKRGTRIVESGTVIQILRTPGVGGPIVDPPYQQIPVSVYYECFNRLS